MTEQTCQLMLHIMACPGLKKYVRFNYHNRPLVLWYEMGEVLQSVPEEFRNNFKLIVFKI